MAGLTEGIPVTTEDGEFNLSGLASGSTLLYFIDAAVDPPREPTVTAEIPASSPSAR